MGYFSDYYVERFENEETMTFVILLNQIKVHNKQRYLLIVAQDMATLKIVRLIDFHGKIYDLYKYQEKWANLEKGDIIRLKCVFHESVNCINVLRVTSDFELIGSKNYYQEIKSNWELKEDVFEDTGKNNIKDVLQVFDTNLEYLGKKLKDKYGFVIYPLYDSELIEYQTKNKKIKYQFVVKDFSIKKCYADIVAYVKDINIRIGDLYTGFALIEFKFKNNRLRLKVYDFLNEDENFKEPTVDFELPF